jgi:hypothetical protein
MRTRFEGDSDIVRNSIWRYFGLVVLLLGHIQQLSAAEPVELPPKDNFFLFLLVGQSNMAGRGEVSKEDRTPVPRVLMLNKENQWVPAIDPLHFDKPKVAGTGLGKTFGIEVAKAYPNAVIGLIPCAVGGSPISSWEPGALDPATKTHPWDDCMTRVRIALQSGTLKGILWHQGEADSTTALSTIYESRLQSLIQRFRTELDAPDVPFLIGQLGQFEKRPWNEAKQQVDAIHQKMASKMPHVAFVSAAGLTNKGDGVHFDSASYRELGRRFAAAYLKLTTD